MRLIDADALWKEIITDIDDGLDLADLREHMDAQPTIEAEPVIRCKDCKYVRILVKNSLWDIKEYVGKCRFVPFYVKDNDFCKWGERAE